MEKKTRIDKTKENIKISDLDLKEKKELFNRFLQSGGEVIREQSRKGLSDFDREKQKGYRSKIDDHKKGLKNGKEAPEGKKTAAGDQGKKQPPSASARPINPIIRFFHRLHIRLWLFFMGITDLYGIYFSQKFLERLNGDVKSNLLEMQLVFMDLFKKNHTTGISIMEDLDRLNPLYYELLEMASSVFDRTVINRIIDHHLHFPNIEQKTTDTREPLMQVLKKLHVLYPYYEIIQTAFEKAIASQMKIEKEKPSIYSLKRKKIKNDMYFIFHKFYPALCWLFNHYNGFIIPVTDPEMMRRLGITENDMPGKRDRAQINRENSPEDSKNGGDEEAAGEEASVPPEVRKGLEIMRNMDLSSLKTRIDKNGLFKFVKDNDKILLAQMLLMEFDEEYSFILTTNKIKYNVLFTQEGKVDYRTKLSDIYNDLRKTMNSFKDYADVLENYEKTRLEKPTSSAQYMDYSNRLSSIDKKRNSTGKDIRMSIKNFMEKVADLTKVLIDDMEGSQKIIENPQEVLAFDPAIEGNKKLNGAKVYSALTTAYYYISALIYRLGPEGDLFGGLEFNEEEMETLKSGKTLLTPGDNQGEKAEDEKDTGIINELEDLF